MEKNQSGSGKSKKIANRQNEERRDELTEQVTETTFSRTRMVKRGACSRQDSDTSDSEIPQIEWQTVNRYIKPKEQKELSANSAATKLISFWDLMGAQKACSNSKRGQYWKIGADENRTLRQFCKEKNR